MKIMTKEINPELIRGCVNENGYAIAKGILNPAILDKVRTAILAEIKGTKVSESIVWSPYIGEPNKLTYSNDNFQCMYRGYIFPWNSESALFDEVLTEVDQVRDLVFPEMKDPYIGKYSTFSLYPNQYGFLKGHKDTILPDVQAFQFIVPLSQKGSDFDEGGLYIINSKDVRVNVDDELELGDVLFFDGRFEHGVETVRGNGVGRMQMFSIPTKFIRPEHSTRLFDEISTRKFIRHKLKKLKNYWKNQ
jgi:hypothetical protein